MTKTTNAEIYAEIVSALPANVELEVAPIPRDWVISGEPESRIKRIARHSDWTAVLWECSAGRFTWHYTQDEVLIMLDGEVFLLQPDGQERRFGPGDVGIFPAGTVCTWRVADRLRKIAMLRQPQWQPIRLVVNLWKQFLRKMGLTKESRLVLALDAFLSRNIKNIPLGKFITPDGHASLN